MRLVALLLLVGVAFAVRPKPNFSTLNQEGYSGYSGYSGDSSSGDNEGKLTGKQKKAIEESILRPWFIQQKKAGLRPFAGVARLCFHDSGTFNPADCSGGAHAWGSKKCNTTNACEYTANDNKGLPQWIDALDVLYDNYNLAKVLTKSDFWHLTCNFGVELSSGLHLPFKAGRTDPKEESPRFPRRLPAAFGFSEVERVFINRLGWSWSDTTAIIGLHSLGGCRPVNSGYQGNWDPTPDTFDNKFYSGLANLQWFPHTIVTPQPSGSDMIRHQFSLGGNNFNRSVMLVTDMGLLYNVTDPTCNVTTGDCPPHAESAELVRAWAKSQSAYFKAFIPAWLKLQSLTCDTLYDVSDYSGRYSPYKPQYPTSSPTPTGSNYLPGYAPGWNQKTNGGDKNGGGGWNYHTPTPADNDDGSSYTTPPPTTTSPPCPFTPTTSPPPTTSTHSS